MHEAQQPDWPLRPWILAALGCITAIIIHQLVGDQSHWHRPGESLRLSLASFVLVSATLLGFTLERSRMVWSIAFSIGGGLVFAGLLYWNGGPGVWEGPDGWRILSAALAVAVAAPFFQVSRDAGRWSTDYRGLFDHAWTNVVIWFAAFAFLAIAWLLAWLLAALFGLIGIDLLEDLLEKGWFAVILCGTALGGAVGLLREQGRIVPLLQRIVLTVLRVLAPVLGAGLLLFLAALPFTGLGPLWEATKSTTPILLVCIVGGLILANAVIGAARDEEATLPPLRYGAMALALALLPLAVIAAVSVGLRIQQYGFTPDRLWALVAVAVAVAHGIAYLLALRGGPAGWAAHVRPANIVLCLGLLGLALLLATPLIGFGAISARDQVARLTSGRVMAERFDWAALAFDFGPAGRRALERLKAGGPAPLRAKAAEALSAKDRWTLGEKTRAAEAAEGFATQVRIVPRPVPLPEPLVGAITRWGPCNGKVEAGRCILRYVSGEPVAALVVLPSGCEGCDPSVSTFVLRSDGWKRTEEDITARPVDSDAAKARAARLADAAAKGAVSIREVRRRQVFIGEEPLGAVFE